VLLKFAGTEGGGKAVDGFRYLSCISSPRAGGVSEVVLLGGFGVTTRGRILDGGELSWGGARSAESLPSTGVRRVFGKSREVRLTLSPVEGVVGSCCDAGDLSRIREEGGVKGWLVPADPRVVSNRFEGEGGSTSSNRSR